MYIYIYTSTGIVPPQTLSLHSLAAWVCRTASLPLEAASSRFGSEALDLPGPQQICDFCPTNLTQPKKRHCNKQTHRSIIHQFHPNILLHNYLMGQPEFGGFSRRKKNHPKLDGTIRRGFSWEKNGFSRNMKSFERSLKSGQMGVSKNRGKTPKMDGENNGSKPYEQMDDLGFQPIFGNTQIFVELIL